jgi:CrcB protein
MTLLLVALGAVVGAPLRYLTDRFIQKRHDTIFPSGTLTINVAGSLIMGFWWEPPQPGAWIP